MFLVRNIKISLKVKAIFLDNALEILKRNNIKAKTFCNFVTFKIRGYTYVLFKTGKAQHTHINVTQIASIKLIKKAIKILVKLMNCTVLRYSIDNIIATSDLVRPINLDEVIKNKKFKKIKYNNEIFPGLFIKFSIGTVIIFHTGRIVIVGCKSERDIKWILENVHANI